MSTHFRENEESCRIENLFLILIKSTVFTTMADTPTDVWKQCAKCNQSYLSILCSFVTMANHVYVDNTYSPWARADIGTIWVGKTW